MVARFESISDLEWSGWFWHIGDVRGRSRARAPRDGFTACPEMPEPITELHVCDIDLS